MANPFDDESAQFTVVRNDRRQHSLWPCAFDVPEGWENVFGPASRGECEAYITAHWTEHTRA
ncbi:MbtH family protein [Streptomyces sp. NPDC014733]|uniref:MbtH family protein n=1 Tax=Streptomyces sp. NPDC014733 TaxID=3364885 RepID=UPI0036F9342B